MKKTLFPLLLAALLAGCSNEPSGNDSNNGNFNEAEITGYLAVNLVAPGGLYGRADGSYQYGTVEENYVNEVRFFFFNDEDQGVEIRKNPLYVTQPSGDGSEGSAASPSPSIPEYFSYYDWDPTPSDNNDYNSNTPGGTETDTGNTGSLEDGTVEKILTAMIVLTGKDGVFPTKVVAIVNPSQAVKELCNNYALPSLSQVQEVISDYYTGLFDSNFVMSNSVYRESSENGGGIQLAKPITKKNFGMTQAEARENQFSIYVERVLARLDMSIDIEYKAPEGSTPPVIIDLPGGRRLFPTTKNVTTEDLIYDPDETGVDQYTNKPVYAEFLGWAVTSTPTKSYLIKNIVPWGADNFLFGDGEPWNIHQYHRSFWAMNPELGRTPTNNDYIWYNYFQLSGLAEDDDDDLNSIEKLGFDIDFTEPTTTYMQENANAHLEEGATDFLKPEEPTKVIFAAQLVDAEGNPMTIADWNGIYFTVPGLQNLAAQMLDMYYIQPGTGVNDIQAKYLPISGEQITFETSSKFFGNSPLFSTTPNYTVYPVLTTASGENASSTTANAAALTWYHLSDNVKYEDATPDDYTLIDPGSIKKYMESVFGSAQIWNNGYTYYYLTIQHLGAEGTNGYHGVVRNHIYKATVTGLTGLGTPVWDPEEPIYPEQPSPDGHNLSAKIEVLSWRIVTDSYEFEW